ncbi:hypothetical protein SDC9_198297 [bioreactor metagenome]|uniref:Uncharacterized protein n=1 Tax=bioreactor metagenome TaxID=1076179 RepID=A0A645IHA9_9ZZZZ
MFHPKVEVVHTMSWSYMYTACVFHGHEIGKVNSVLYFVLHRHKVPYRAFIFKLCKFFSEHGLKNFKVHISTLLENVFDKISGCDQNLFRTVLLYSPEL